MKFFTCLVPLFWFSTFALGNEERPPWAGFSGQAMVRLAEKTDGGFRVQVLRVNRVWKNNRASKPESLAGQSILVGFRGEGEARMMQQAFARTLERGQTFPLELGHGEGNRWYVLELNGDQRESARRALGSGRGDIRREREREQPRERGFDREARPEREIERDAHRRELEMIEKRKRESRDAPREAELSRSREGAGDLRIDAVRQELQVELLRSELRNVHMENAELRFRLQQLENRLRVLEKR